MVEKIRVLVVDDSSFFRKRIRHALERSGEIEVAGEAADGREAVQLAASLRPDLITMDVAMPLMDGIAAVRTIMRDRPVPIIMFSSLTSEGARATLDALEAGAVDFIAKQGGVNGEAGGMPADHLCERVIAMARHRYARRSPVPRGLAGSMPAAPVCGAHGPVERRAGTLHLVVIGASTGGPVAIQRVLAQLPADYPYPVLIGVHMPAEFTATFAERLDTQCPIKVRQAANGDALLPGQALLAPGGMQTLVEAHAGGNRVRVIPGAGQLYKPSVDIMFEAAANALGDGVQAVVLTGMGADGTQGARVLKARGSSVWSQDQATSVVYGMPMSVVKAGCSDRVMPLDEIGAALSGLA